MNEPKQEAARQHQFDEVARSETQPADHLEIDDLGDVRLTITADLGQASMLVREVLELRVGSIIPLDKIAGEMTDISMNGIRLAKGEVVVIGDSLHVRIHEVIGAEQEEQQGDEALP